MKIFSIVGARPQFIKLSPLSNLLSKYHQEIIVHTGQHYDYAMSENIFNDLGIRKPDIHLEISHSNPTIQITQMMLKLEAAMIQRKPDLIIVFGDTNSTLAGALVAAKLCIPIVHIEAGLRSYNRNMPEEVNRVITDHVSEYLFSPTKTASEILKCEGLEKNTYLTGDIMVDTIKNNLKIALEKSNIIADLRVKDGNFNLLTLHRNYNVDHVEVLEHLLNEIGKLDEIVIFPIHPRTKKRIADYYEIPENIQIIEPLGYLDFITLEYFSKRIVTDSGGIQKEAYILKKPCITLRSETEWVETVEEKWNLLVDPADKQICAKINSFIVPENQADIFGKDVSERMLEIISKIDK
ncbi:MAG: UDP-N-acetylglucosamine 2-epimerase (non-hydrolyzing) [Ginsengibacter sp.]